MTTALPKVAICFPSADMVNADFALALAGLCNSTPPLETPIVNNKSSIVAAARNDAVRRARELGCDHILFLDSDMTFPRTTLHRLLVHREQLVAGGDDGDARARAGRHDRAAHGCEHAKLGGAESHARLEHRLARSHVLARPAHEPARLDADQELDLVSVAPRLLDCHDSVGTRRDRRSGRDRACLPRREHRRGRRARP